MGVCLSKCGDAHQKAAVAAASISHHSSPAADLQHDPNRSLKKFLHLYDDDAKRSASSPRPSLDDCLVIPHSSELFSLPDEGSAPSRSLSPARTSRGSIARSSISSRATSSPQSRAGGRSSTDKLAFGSKGSARKWLPRGSFSSGDHDPAHQHLVETIARLERFCDGKLMERRSSSVHDAADSERSSEIGASALPASETSQEDAGRAGITLHDCHNLARKLAGFGTGPSVHNAGAADARSPADDRSATKPAKPLGSKKRDASDSCMESPATRARLEAADDLMSFGGPFKKMPIENSVTLFLKEVEKFVAMIEAPKGLGATEAPAAEEVGGGATRLAIQSFEEIDDTMQFTTFEATFDDDCYEEAAAAMPAAEADPDLVGQPASSTLNAPEESSTSEESAACTASEPETLAVSEIPATQIPPEDAQQSDNTAEWVEILVAAISCKEAKKAGGAARPALADIDGNIALMTHEAPAAAKKSPLMARPPKGLRRGISRSLDSRECLITQVDELNALKRDQRLQMTRLFTTQAQCSTTQVTRVGEAAPANDFFLPDLGAVTASDQMANDTSDAAPYATGGFTASISETATSELSLENNTVANDAPPQPTITGVMSPFDLRFFEAWDACLEQYDDDCGGRYGEGTPAAETTPAGEPQDEADPTPIRGIHAGLNEDSKEFLSKAFDSILKLLQSPHGERPWRHSGKLLEFLAAEMEAPAPPAGPPEPPGAPEPRMEASTHETPTVDAPEGEAPPAVSSEPERWHDAPSVW